MGLISECGAVFFSVTIRAQNLRQQYVNTFLVPPSITSIDILLAQTSHVAKAHPSPNAENTRCPQEGLGRSCDRGRGKAWPWTVDPLASASECWDYGCVPTHPAGSGFLKCFVKLERMFREIKGGNLFIFTSCESSDNRGHFLK